MAFCPNCRSEYRAAFTRCADCDVDLVDALDDDAPTSAGPRELLADKNKAFIPQANLAACREMERTLLDGGVVCYVHAEEADADVALGSAAAMQYAVVIDENDVDEVKKIFKGRFESMLAREGFGSLQTEAIDPEADQVHCPACGHQGPLEQGACADCGLFLGAPD